MMSTCMKVLADELVSGLRESLSVVLGQDEKEVWAVCVCGSYVRGDFFDRNSDLDFHLVFTPGSSAARDPHNSEGFLAVKGLADRLLAGREFICHNPYQFDWLVSSYESLPKTQADIHIPDGSPEIPLLSIFLFDYIQNLLVLWGSDPRSVMPDPLPFPILAKGWFSGIQAARKRYLEVGSEWRIPFSTFKSIQVGQISFGEQTLDKRSLLELYSRNVPDFPLKDFGCEIIRGKLEQTFPDKPCKFAPWEKYATFEDQLADLTLASIQEARSSSEQAVSGDA